MLPANAASVVDSAEARQLPALIAEWEAAGDARTWLARALRVDLALLTELPHLALPTLARRCAFDAAWYRQAPEGPPEAAAATALAEAWAAAPGPRHLRAVRPPAVPLTGGVVEEYRTSVLGELCLSGDGTQLGVVGDAGMIAWDRASGRRTDRGARPGASGAWSPLLPARSGATWSLARENTWEYLVLESSAGDKIAIDLGVDLIGRAVHAIDDGRVIVDCDDPDAGARHWLIDVRAQRIVWTASGDCRAAVLDGAHVISGSSRGVAIQSVATGDAHASWAGPAVDAIAVLRGGAIVTRSGAVIRVWERTARGAELAGTYGWTTAQFSPTGDRLVTGGNLCHARTGAHVARMQVNGPGWLEGGPPAPCQALVDDAFIEIQPMGLRVWDGRDGRLRVTDSSQVARIGDRVAFDPRGRYYAIGHRQTGKLAVRALAGGTTLLAHTVPLATGDALGFTADGEALWWHAKDGTRWIQPVSARGSERALAADQPTPVAPPPITHAVRGGLLVVGELAAPCDEPEVVASPDGRAFAARRSHYVIVD
jgi:hypothetical protein